MMTTSEPDSRRLDRALFHAVDACRPALPRCVVEAGRTWYQGESGTEVARKAKTLIMQS